MMAFRIPDGPFRVHQVPEGAPYELTRGHPVYCPPRGRRHGSALGIGVLVFSDPAVQGQVGIDVGFALDDRTLRAPDISIGGLANEPGWAEGAPRLAIEYADEEEDEADLQRKIAEFLAAGTEAVWVVRLQGDPRVEVHEREGTTTFARDAVLPPVGGLSIPVPVAALFDRRRAEARALRNLTTRHAPPAEARAILLDLVERMAGQVGAVFDEHRRSELAKLSLAQIGGVFDALDSTGRWP